MTPPFMYPGFERPGMAGWRRQVDDLLYEGEAIRDTVEFDGSQVVVTSHRVLAFTPEAEGANFTQVERPNVAGVDTGARAESSLLERAIRIGVLGAVLLVAGWIIDFGSILGDIDLGGGGAAGQLGIGNILGSLQQMLAILRNLDQYMLLGGALALLLAVGLAGVYWWQRERTLVIEVAGDDDIHIPRPSGAPDAASRLERAIAPEPSDNGRSPDPQAEA
jgi:hypothetical protein